MQRRKYLRLLPAGLLLGINTSLAITQRPLRKIGFLILNGGYEEEWQALTKRLESLGWIDGENIQIVYKYSKDNVSKIKALTEELVAEKVELIVVTASQGVVEVIQVTKDTPVVGVGMIDPVSAGFVKNLARPESNVTGTSYLSNDVGKKLLELVQLLQPQSTSIATFINSSGKLRAHLVELFKTNAATFGMNYEQYFPSNAAEIERDFKDLVNKDIKTLIVLLNPLYVTQRFQLSNLSLKYKIATYTQWAKLVSAGLLVSYGNDVAEAYSNGALFIDRILRGAAPQELPIYQVSAFETVINLKTAKALNLPLNQELLLRTDRFVE